MGNIFKTAFKSGKFRFGFFFLIFLLLLIFLYPIFVRRDPLKMEGGMFESPNLFEMMGGDKAGDSSPAAVDHGAATDLMAQFGLVAVQREKPKQLYLLGTDNFGRDVMTELVAATRTSLLIGIMAGSIATIIGLSIGLLAGYMGGQVDNFLSTVINIFIVIPSFVILILISVGMKSRGFVTTALVIGITAWPWTARSVRAQTTSLRNRDHVNLSKLSGHSMPRIILRDVLPYVASYVVMAFILQLVSGILSEASLSMLGLGPQNVATLGLMMSWAVTFSALPNGAWWAYLPVVAVIVLTTFSLNLINSGLDQIFNPQIRS
jgi:peptide/nickel transport system permease protein